MNPIICYGFNRQSVERKDFTSFFSHWWPTDRPEGDVLRSAFDSFVFYVTGYDDDPRELFAIPEVRAFFREFNDRWPFWLFACSLDQQTLLTMTFCCLETLEITTLQGGQSFRADFDTAEMRQFLEKEFQKLEALCWRAGMSAEEAIQRRQQALEYFRTDWRSFAP